MGDASAFRGSTSNGTCPSGGTGLFCNLPNRKDYHILRTCLVKAFPPDNNQRLGFHQLPKVTYPDNDEYYPVARRNPYGFRQPAVVVMAETEEDVVAAVKCATAAGYNISPRGRNHHYQGLSNMDGHVVVDCSLLCNPDTFKVDKREQDWLLPGQKIIGTITSGSGCTNAVMLAASFKNFEPKEGALYAIGTCPSVGITGYTTGGGSGDITPQVGWGADDILEARIVLANASVVTANPTNEHADLFWATQGGGSGFGIITQLTTVVAQAPPSSEETRKYCFVTVRYSTPDDETRRAFLTSFQDFLYEVDPLVSSKFGGNGGLNGATKFLTGIYLGSGKEFLETFRNNGLLEDGHMDNTVNPFLMMDYDILCDGTAPCVNNTIGVPSTGIAFLAEFSTYQEAMVFKLCTQITGTQGFLGSGATYTQTSGDWCADLGISSEFCTVTLHYADFIYEATTCAAVKTALGIELTAEQCEKIATGNSNFDFLTKEKCVGENGISEDICDQLLRTMYSEPHCYEQEVVTALVEAAYDPLSFLNNAGPPEWFFPFWESFGIIPGATLDNFPSSNGGLLIPKVDVNTLMDLDMIGVSINHMQHGAPMQKKSPETAFPWRDTAIMVGAPFDANVMLRLMDRMAEFYGDATKLQGYYNYMQPVGNPNWRYYYFGENYERLSHIKLHYDPLNVFGNPMQVSPAFSPPSTGSPGPSPSPSGGGSVYGGTSRVYLKALVASVLIASFAFL